MRHLEFVSIPSQKSLRGTKNMFRLQIGLLPVAVLCGALLLSGCGGTSGNAAQNGSFTLSPSQSTVTVAEGNSAQDTITVNPENGFTGTVSLTASTPSGVSASFNPASTSSSSTLTLSSSSTGTYTVAVTGTSGSLTSNATITFTVTKVGTGIIEHVVVIVQENRTTDTLFQGLCIAPQGSPSACGTGTNQYNIQNYGYTSDGSKVALTPVPGGLITPYDLGHSHDNFLEGCDWNGTACVNNGFDQIGCGGSCPSDASYQYVQASGPTYNSGPYITMAQTYAFDDMMFQTNQGPSFPAHQFLFSGASAVCTPGESCPAGTTDTYYVADNPSNNDRSDGTAYAGCLAPPASVVNVIDTSQPFPNSTESQITGTLAECFSRPTLADVLGNASLSWKYYAPTTGSIWTAPDAIDAICQPYSADGNYDDTVCNGSEWQNNVDIEGSGADIITAIQGGNLANVSWVIPTGQNSDHPGNSIDNGPSWVSSIVNAIGATPYWNNTAIIVVWDDFGGWFDHVPPPISSTNSLNYGFRVPLIAISAYAKPAYISHQQNDFGSILKFIEEQFGLPNIGQSQGLQYADYHALGDLSDCFDFSQSPQPFTAIQAPLKADYFLHDTSPPLPPDND
jgi:phospholipase C